MTIESLTLNSVSLLIEDCLHATAPVVEEGYPLIRTPNIGKGRFDLNGVFRVTEETYEKWTRRAVPQDGDLILAREAPAGNVAIVKNGDKVCLGQRTVLIRPDPKKVDPDFLCYYLLAPRQQGFLLSTATGVTAPHVNMKDIRRLPLQNLPKLDAQKRAGSLLSAYDELMENNRRRMELLEESARLLYREWFVRLRFPGHEHTHVTNGLPQGWERKCLGDIVRINKGRNITKATVEEGTVPVVAGGLEPAYFHSTPNAKGPVVTISASGANSGFVNIYFEDIWASDCSFISGEWSEDIYYFYYLLKSRQSELFALQKGAAQPHVYPKDIQRMSAAFPVKRVLEYFRDAVSPSFELIANLKKQNQKTPHRVRPVVTTPYERGNYSMKAEDVRLTELLEGPKQFIVPVFQRDYSWGTKHCLQLWKDIVRVGSNENAKAHFVGSIVYIAAEEISAKITRWLLIDGQQRLTTLTILLAAMRNRLPKGDANAQPADDEDALPTRAELEDYYLSNVHGRGDRRHKLHLRRADQETLEALLDGKEQQGGLSEHILENFEFFAEKLANTDLDLVYRGIKKLVAVDVSLMRGQDDPQMIFESLNSTGLDLTQADLIRNFVLMGLDEQLQTQLYKDHWRPIEIAFGARYRTDFDKFVRDYLTLKLKPSKQLKADEIYQQFRNYFYSVGGATPIGDILANLRRFGNYYVAFSLGQESNDKLKEVFRRLRLLVEVASPVVLKLYHCFDRTKTLALDEFVQAVELLESYVFRRSICDMQTRSLGQIFAQLAYRINDDAPLLSLKVALYRQAKKRRFPTDAEFREGLETRDVYDMRHCHYLLDRLENDSKEKIDTSTFTIEHIMPQNETLRPEWQEMLGVKWKDIQETWLHRLGNITLTAYNSEYNDIPFEKKKSLVDKHGRQVGFDFSPLRLNKFVREQQAWTEAQIEKRGKDLAARGVGIWPTLVVDMAAVKAAELEDRKAQAAKYSLDNLEFDEEAKKLFDLLRPQILALGEDVIELCGARSVTYRVYDFFVEMVPRKRRLLLVLNLDFEECDDPSQRIFDATEYAFITNASESGGVGFSLEDSSHIAPAVHVIRQAYENVAE